MSMKLKSKIRSFVKSYLGGGLGNTGDMTWIPHNFDWNFWQEDKRGGDCSENTAVEACVSAITQTVAMMPLQHWKKNPDGGKELVPGAIADVLRRPNGYQSQTDFILNLLRSELLTGNGIAYAKRLQGEIDSLHLVPANSGMPSVDPETHAVFYSVGNNPLEYSEMGVMIPARDILHIRSHTPRHPLIGETPLVAAGLAAASGTAIQAHNRQFFMNMSKGSGVLMTDMDMGPDEVKQLRARWLEHTSKEGIGGTPILTHALKWQPMSVNAVDSEVIEMYKLTVLDVARVFRVPPPIIGAMEASTFNNVEALMKHWISTGLGYTTRHIEEALDRLFDLPADEEIMFDTSVLLRSDFKARMDGLAKGVMSGIFAPNEARNSEGYASVDNGDEPRLQQQVVPLSFHYQEENRPDYQGPEEPPADPVKVLEAAALIRKAMH